MIIAAVVWAVLAGGAFAVFMGVTIFGGTQLSKESTEIAGGKRTEEYRWDGDPFILTKGSSKPVTCVVRPDDGEQRPVSNYKDIRFNRIYEKTAWFSGSATVDCNRSVTLRTGANLKMYKIMNHRVTKFGAAAVAAGPLAAVFVFGSRRKVNG